MSKSINFGEFQLITPIRTNYLKPIALNGKKIIIIEISKIEPSHNSEYEVFLITYVTRDRLKRRCKVRMTNRTVYEDLKRLIEIPSEVIIYRNVDEEYSAWQIYLVATPEQLSEEGII